MSLATTQALVGLALCGFGLWPGISNYGLAAVGALLFFDYMKGQRRPES